MELITAFLYLLGIGLFALIGLCLFIYVATSPYPYIVEYESEKFYVAADTGDKIPFPSIVDPPACSLSVIVPAYNEEERLPSMMEECINFLEARQQKDSSFTYEVLIVDDGSSDSTTKVGLEFTQHLGSNKVRVLTLAKNRGKGGAVRLGILKARGEVLLFADADGATKFSDYNKVEGSLKEMCKAEKSISESLAIACGSRAHLEKESVAKRSFFRTILMYGFHALVWIFTVRSVRDTQCGFKLLTRRTARIVFNSLHIEKWAFDVEMLFIAEALGIPISEIAVEWTEIDGSKVTPVISWLQMGRDLILISLRYALGAWRIRGDLRTQ